MLASMRRMRILEEVKRSGGARVSDLTQLLGVSDMTVRRDIDLLAQQGQVAKVHGGATAIELGSSHEPGFEVKSVRALTEKSAIATTAAEMVQPGTAIGLTAGTTTWAVAQQLGDVADLTVVTNSLKVAEVLYERDRADSTVVLTGGIRTPSNALVGPTAVAAINALHLDLVLMGVHGIDPDAGLTTPNLMEADTNRAFIEAGRRLVVVADHTKVGVVGLSEIAPLGAVDTLVTDDRISAEDRRTLSESVGELVVVPIDGEDEASQEVAG